nr:hypothetical protein L203_04872 [Cryptococcus depauperatus CBS 7841]
MLESTSPAAEDWLVVPFGSTGCQSSIGKQSTQNHRTNVYPYGLWEFWTSIPGRRGESLNLIQTFKFQSQSSLSCPNSISLFDLAHIRNQTDSAILTWTEPLPEQPFRFDRFSGSWHFHHGLRQL